MPASPKASIPLDWAQGRWARPGAGRARTSLVIAADWAPIRAFGPLVAADPEAVYGDLLPVLRAAGLRIANLECPLTRLDQPAVKSGSVLKGAPDHVRGLTAVPFELVTLANNHVFDHGLAAFQETQDLLAAQGIRTVGAGLTAEAAFRPQVLDLDGVRVGILNFSEGEDLTGAGPGPGVFGWDQDRAAAILADLGRTADVRVVIFHGGVEYIPFPPPYVVSALRALADAGADLVVAHHPHVPQGVEIRGRTPICYSLGNFLFHQDTRLLHRKTGYLVRAELGRGGLTGLEVIPYRIGPLGLRLLGGPDRDAFFASLRAVSEPLAAQSGVTDAWHGFLRWVGRAGFRAEVERILGELAERPPIGAAMFRNRLTTLQHREQWQDLLTRIMAGDLDTAPQWAFDLVDEWQARTLPGSAQP
jgi:poly-gamma-glutamate synthesis protein (capsule biosynthesis protein)